jgi:hypothetical protein
MDAPPAHFWFARAAGKVVGWLAAGTVLGFFLVGCLCNFAQQSTTLFQSDEIGYGDSYVLYDVLRFQRTGEIYRDLSLAPYLPAQYSPLMYIIYAVPGRFYRFVNPFVGPRLVALASFLLCAGTTVAIAHTLIQVRYAWWWGGALTGSIGVMRDWVLQVRADFLSIAFGLLTIRLLLIESNWAVLLAGLCAGFAIQFKLNCVAAALSGTLWLLIRRRWQQLGIFAIAATLTSAGLYFGFWAWEHRMFGELMAMSPGIYDVHGYFGVILQVMREPVVLLAVMAVSTVFSHLTSRGALLILYISASFSVAAVSDLQAGGNTNYFYEFLFALIPAAVLGGHRLLTATRLRIDVGLGVIALVAFNLLPALIREDARPIIESVAGPNSVKSKDQEFLKVQEVLQGRHFLSFIPRLALLDPQPALTDGFLLTYLHRIRKFDPKPIWEGIDQHKFDFIVTAKWPQEWRGILHVDPELRAAINVSYQPYCIYSAYLFHLPRSQSSDSAEAQELGKIGCQPVSCGLGSTCPSW